jgi:hypothetical protein
MLDWIDISAQVVNYSKKIILAARECIKNKIQLPLKLSGISNKNSNSGPNVINTFASIIYITTSQHNHGRHAREMHLQVLKVNIIF